MTESIRIFYLLKSLERAHWRVVRAALKRENPGRK